MTMSIDGTLTLSAQTQIFGICDLFFFLLLCTLLFLPPDSCGNVQKERISNSTSRLKEKGFTWRHEMKGRSTKGFVVVLIDSVNGLREREVCLSFETSGHTLEVSGALVRGFPDILMAGHVIERLVARGSQDAFRNLIEHNHRIIYFKLF